MRAWRLTWRVARYRPGLFAYNVVLWAGFHSLPLAVGLVLQRFFDAVGDQAAAGYDLLSLLAVLAGVEAARLVTLWLAWVSWSTLWARMTALLRLNMLRAQLASGGGEAARLPETPGEAVSRFRDDAEDLLKFLDTWLDVAGTTAFATVAVAVMIGIDPLVTVAVVLPVAGVAIATHVLTARIRAWRLADRRATAAVTGFLGELFGAPLTVKAAGAGDAVLARFARLNAARRRTALRDRLCTDLLDSFNASTVDVAIGVVLLLAVPALRRGELSVGDLTLFAAYADHLVWLPYFGGRLLARRRQADVAIDRMAALLPPDATSDLVTHRPLDPATSGQVAGCGAGGDRAPATAPAGAAGDGRGAGSAAAGRRDRPLLEARGLTALHPSGRGVVGVDLTLARGTLTVVRGPVGAGKSTLLRGLLGLTPVQDGEIRWNGTVLADPAAHLVPPRCAYVPQVPRLFSEPLADNLLLGARVTGEEITRALRLAAFDEDVAGMPERLDTLVGARGVRLSGGQAQRAAVARALVRRPELVCLDDVSSALDVDTERRLWDRLLADEGTTWLVVSDRPATLARADRVLTLERGRVLA
jgi:ATP-binding cassette subfamily B protein